MIRFWIALCAILLASEVAAQPVQHPHLEWTRNASIYEVNIRQYTPEGTIRAFEKHLPRLRKMGVKIHRREEPQGEPGQLLRHS
jgi:hypothetical protein